MHKNPTKARFIIAKRKCSVKPISSAVIAALKLIYRLTGNYNFKTQYYAGVKTCLPIQSHESVIATINKLNSRNKAISVSHLILPLYIRISHITN